MNTGNPDPLINAKEIEVRRVPPDWQHPTDENGAFVPLKPDFQEALYSFQIYLSSTGKSLAGNRIPTISYRIGAKKRLRTTRCTTWIPSEPEHPFPRPRKRLLRWRIGWAGKARPIMFGKRP